MCRENEMRDDGTLTITQSNSQVFDGGTDELNACILQLLREIRILTEEAITRMDGLHAILHAQSNDGIDVQIRRNGRFFRVEFECLIGLVSVLGESIYFSTSKDVDDQKLV